MPAKLFELGAKDNQKSESQGPRIVMATVINNCPDRNKQGKVLVRIPTLNQEVWARVSGQGAGSNRGLLCFPKPDDEVLVALDHDEASVVGGHWNSKDEPPVSAADDVQHKWVIQTETGHRIEFDDAGKTITITRSNEQKITMDKDKIELSDKDGNIKLTMDTSKKSITLKADSIELTATNSIKLQAGTIEIGDMDKTNNTTIKGTQVNIN